MVTRIEKLTPEQEVKIQEWVKRHVDIALNPEVKFSEDLAKEGVLGCYEAAYLAAPQHVVFVDSPQEGALLSSMLTSQKFLDDLETGRKRKSPRHTDPVFQSALKKLCEISGDNYLPNVDVRGLEFDKWGDFFGGSGWISWNAFERFFVEVCGLEMPEKIEQAAAAYAQANRNSGWFWTFAEGAIVVRKHVSISLDQQGRLHNASGPAISWRDGTKMYSLQGVPVPEQWVTDTQSVDPVLALTHPNVEQRRVLRDLLGWPRILESVGGVKVVHADPDPSVGTLLELTHDGKKMRFLKMLCATGREFVERVGPDWGDTALEVAARRWGLSAEQYHPEAQS